MGPIENVIDASQLPGGVYRYSASGAAYTPQGERIDAGIDVELPVPTWQADRAGQPSTAPTSTPTGGPSTPSPSATQGVPLAVTATGRFLTKPLELVTVGSPVEFTHTVTNISTADVPLEGGRTLAPGQSVELTKAETLVSAQDMKDGYVTPAPETARGTLPDGASISVLGPYDYRLPIPATPPVAAEVPDLDVTVTGAFQAAEGEPIVAGTKVRWIAALTNTGTVDLHDVGVADGRKLAELPIGASGAVVFETTVSERDLIDHSISVDARAGAVTPAGVDYSEQVLGTLAVPAVAPAPVDPVGPAAAPVGPDSRPAAAPVAGAAARQATQGTSTGTAASTGSGSTRTSAAQLASTGSDAAAALPVAGVLALLGALGVLVGRRRRPTGSAS